LCVRHQLSPRQVRVVLAGGLINEFRERLEREGAGAGARR
jgi:hypothetical protein